MPEATRLRVHVSSGVFRRVRSGLDQWSYIVISLCNGISFAAISTPVLERLSPTCLSFGTAIAVLAVPVLPPLRCDSLLVSKLILGSQAG